MTLIAQDRRSDHRWILADKNIDVSILFDTGDVYKAYIANISKRGMGLVYEDSFPENSQSGNLTAKTQLGNLVGQVAWFKADSNSSQLGVELKEFDDQGANLLEKLLLLKTDHLASVIRQEFNLSSSGECSKIENWFLQKMKSYLERLTGLETIINEDRDNDRDLFHQFSNLSNQIINEGEDLVQELKNRKVEKLIKQAFRKILIPWQVDNPFTERALKKPRGYPGDYMMMELGYSINKEHSQHQGILGIFDKYNLTVFECVKARKDVAKNRLHKLITQEVNSPSSVMSLGGGPCREWFELEQEISKKFYLADFTCLDQDTEALDFSRARLAGNKLLNSVEFFRDSLLDFSTSEKWLLRVETYDLIYGMGIANYFYEDTLSRMISRAFKLLKPGGELIIEHKVRGKFKYSQADWFCDWIFVERTEEEFAKMFNNALSEFPGASCSFEHERKGELVFGVAKKSKI